MDWLGIGPAIRPEPGSPSSRSCNGHPRCVWRAGAAALERAERLAEERSRRAARDRDARAARPVPDDRRDGPGRRCAPVAGAGRRRGRHAPHSPGPAAAASGPDRAPASRRCPSGGAPPRWTRRSASSAGSAAARRPGPSARTARATLDARRRRPLRPARPVAPRRPRPRRRWRSGRSGSPSRTRCTSTRSITPGPRRSSSRTGATACRTTSTNGPIPTSPSTRWPPGSSCGARTTSAPRVSSAPVTATVVEPRRDDEPAGRAGERLHVATGTEIRTFDLLTRQLIGTIAAPGVPDWLIASRGHPRGGDGPDELARPQVERPDLGAGRDVQSLAGPPPASRRRGAVRRPSPSRASQVRSCALTWSSPHRTDPGGHRVLGEVRDGSTRRCRASGRSASPGGTRSPSGRGRPRRSASGTARPAGTSAGPCSRRRARRGATGRAGRGGRRLPSRARDAVGPDGPGLEQAAEPADDARRPPRSGARARSGIVATAGASGDRGGARGPPARRAGARASDQRRGSGLPAPGRRRRRAPAASGSGAGCGSRVEVLGEALARAPTAAARAARGEDPRCTIAMIATPAADRIAGADPEPVMIPGLSV